MANGILKNTKLFRAASIAAGTGTTNGTVQDMSGFECVAAVAMLGTLTATNVTAIKLQQGNQSDGSDMADITGAVSTGDDTMSNKALAVEAIKPTKRYVRYVITRTTANAVIDGVLLEFSGPVRKQPVSHDASIAVATQVVSN